MPYNTYMTQRKMNRPFKDLSEGKEWFSSWLIKNGFKDVKETDQYCHWDLEGTYKGQRYLFELKNRTFLSWTYNDVFLNKDKYDWLREQPEKVILVMFWTDKFVMLNLKTKTPDEVTYENCKRQTRFSDQRVVRKQVVKWNLDGLKLLEYD